MGMKTTFFYTALFFSLLGIGAIKNGYNSIGVSHLLSGVFFGVLFIGFRRRIAFCQSSFRNISEQLIERYSLREIPENLEAFDRKAFEKLNELLLMRRGLNGR
jgi:hypothetical protein